MSWNAIICKLVNVEPHPEADRLLLAQAMGERVIIGLDEDTTQLGVLFSSEGYLSEKMIRENNLSSIPEKNKDIKKKGYLGKNGRIKALKFRGQKSEGLWLSLSSLEWTGVDLSTLRDGFEFTHLKGELVAEKYIPSLIRKQAKKINQKREKKLTLAEKIQKSFERKEVFLEFKEHFDTAYLDRNLHNIPKGSIIYLSSKLEGTSGRTGYLPQSSLLSPVQNYWNRAFGWIHRIISSSKYEYISGSRRRSLKRNGRLYSQTTFREEIHEQLKTLQLPQGITLYYEIVGWNTLNGKPIMGTISIEKVEDKKIRKELEKLYGEKIVFSYGCDPTQENNHYRVFVYRATLATPDGKIFELPWSQVKGFCDDKNLRTVPILGEPFIYNGDRDSLLAKVNSFLDLPDNLDNKHPREGVCIRVEKPNGETIIFKKKSWIYKLLRGFAVVDTEQLEDLLSDDLEKIKKNAR